MSNSPESPTPKVGAIITFIAVVAIVAWIILGAKFLGLISFFASFLFFWYWAAVEGANLKQWPSSALGALVGLALAWQSQWLPAHFGNVGLACSIAVIVIALYIQIMNWAPLAINRCAMLFLTVLAAPAILDKLDTTEMAMAIGLGALYFGAVVKVVTALSAKPA